jgi:hypothetical protein
MPLKLNSAGGGSVTIDVPSTASNFTLTAPANNGSLITTADSNTVTQSMISRSGFYGGFGPTFQASFSGTQTVTAATWTKVTVNSESWDTATCYDPTTNYRFTPNVAGYYMFSALLTTTAAVTTLISNIYKNGAVALYSSRTDATSGASVSLVTGMLYMNGTTDYVELYGYTSSTVFNTARFDGFLARPA